MTSFIDGMAERDIPLSVFHFDCFWMRVFHWCDFVRDLAIFPDPSAMLARLKGAGAADLRLDQPLHRAAVPAVRRGSRARLPGADRDRRHLALGHVAGRDGAARPGGRCFETDVGERIPTEGVRWHDGSEPQNMHDFYATSYNRAGFELLEAERGPGEAVLFARSATAGGQQYPVHWDGDSESTFPSMAESLRGGLSLALSGIGDWSHDIGGRRCWSSPRTGPR